MCGIAGFMSTEGHTVRPDEIIRQMTAAIIHRGPDADGHWLDCDAGVALGHRRLSILDLSPEGSQPMVSASGRYVIVYNGEIYNYRDIRVELDDRHHHTWRGHSDTEVILAAIEEYGIERALKSFVGMFAFALWDRQERAITIARDRLGEKPLYYGRHDGNFIFASELKALQKHPAFSGDIDRNSIALFLRHNYIPAPYSIYRGIHKLLPGTYLTISISQRDATPTVYWSAHSAAETGKAQPFVGSDKEAVDRLEQLLRQSVCQQMVADVPLGAFLSGGIDSTTIVALMQAQSCSPVRTFTIGFHEEGYNEADQAKAVAHHLGTNHTELYVTPSQALDVIPRLPQLYDEPFSDSSQIPTFLVSQMTQQHVTVSLSGDAGDELFGGYGRYLMCDRLLKKIGWLPRGFVKNVSRVLSKIPPDLLDKGFSWLSPAWERYVRPGKPSAKLQALIRILQEQSPELLYQSAVSHWKDPASIVIGATEPLTVLTDKSRYFKGDSNIANMMYFDLMSYLPDDILVKVDRAAMGVSLETRVPLLDHRVVEFALTLPTSLKIRHGITKWPLRQVLYRYVPQDLMERPKMGFGVPIDSWLRGPLRDWAEELLGETRLKNEGFFDPAPIRTKWAEHLSGTHRWHYYLWDILMFQAWLESQQNA